MQMMISDGANTQVPADARAGKLEKQARGGAGGLCRSFLSPFRTLQSDTRSLHHKGENESLSPSRHPKLTSQCWELSHLPTYAAVFLLHFKTDRVFCGMLQRCFEKLIV